MAFERENANTPERPVKRGIVILLSVRHPRYLIDTVFVRPWSPFSQPQHPSLKSLPLLVQAVTRIE